MIEVFLKGLGVGVAVAAPVGPIGLLCIKRTLARGWTTGFATGLGVASADATYGLMVAAGLAATGLLVAFATPMQIAGGLMIAGLGAMSLRTFVNGPAPDLHAAEAPGARGLGTAFGSGYLLTLSNPMTILAFAGLVAGLGATAAGQPGAAYMLVGGIFAGSALWWATLATASSLARRRITPRITRWLDLASGLVLLVWGLWIALTALTA
ncbi:LysE family translocator [Sinisalibacter aestuarii]|uniref:Lysine transporter LysE n=1 Tax=Sinisalibacter aestuarii TaxID=2949426 RepID=A0ABQ5LVM3_9RHOB|nr:LysE family transporter [Sinisalibacter aestuarii]GKY88162.1 lysine transporter LysE [Sinisalibacter aestuarii]